MDSILSYVRIELGLGVGVDIQIDKLLQSYITRSCNRIKHYLNRDIDESYILNNYPDAVIELTCNIYRNKKLKSTTNGIKSIKEGDISITYEDSNSIGITEDIRELLPLPYISMY